VEKMKLLRFFKNKIFQTLKKKIVKILFITLISAVLFLTGTGSVYGLETAEFLHLTQGAKPSGMGDAYSSVSDCVFNFDFNPAGISFADSNQIAFSHYEYYADIKNEYFAVSLKPQKKFALAASLKMTSIDDVERDAFGNQTGKFGNNSYQIKAGAGFLLSKKFGAGLALSYISNKIYDKKSSAIAFDAGVLFSNIFLTEYNKINFGLSFQNFGDKMSFGGKSYELPKKTRIGFSFMNDETFPKIIRQTTFSADFVINSELENTLNLGIETLFFKNFALRMGLIDYMNVNQKSSLTFGAGLQHSFGDIDYAYRSHETLGGAHTLSFTIKFGGKY